MPGFFARLAHSDGGQIVPNRQTQVDEFAHSALSRNEILIKAVMAAFETAYGVIQKMISKP